MFMSRNKLMLLFTHRPQFGKNRISDGQLEKWWLVVGEKRIKSHTRGEGGGDLTKSCTGKLKKNIPAEWIALCGSYLAATLYCNIYFLLLINGILTYQVFSTIRKPDIFLSQGSYILCTATLSWTLVLTLAKTYPYGYSVCTRRIKVLLLLLLFLDNHSLKVNNPAYQFVVWTTVSSYISKFQFDPGMHGSFKRVFVNSWCSVGNQITFFTFTGQIRIVDMRFELNLNKQNTW